LRTKATANPLVERLAAASNDFGFRLLAQLAEQDAGKNLFVSPSSVAMALAMTYNGAKGTTKQAMAETLGLAGMSRQEVNEAHAALRESLEDPDPDVQLAVANSLWGRKDLAFQPDFIQRNTDCYGAEIASVDFLAPGTLDTINGWVKEKTHDKIDDLVKQPDLNVDTVLILINAIYFKGIWTVPFDEAGTEEGTFTLLDGTEQRRPMMSQSGHYNYYEDETVQAVSLPYGNGRISMYIFLPREQERFVEFQKALSAGDWKRWMVLFHDAEGEITLPRFKVEYEGELSQPLTGLGMGVAFGDQADFSGMGADPLQISRVRHKTFVEVNEEGTEAAAATAVVMRAMSLAPPPFKMVVDRPFFCAIRDNQTGAILFMGFIVEPG